MTENDKTLVERLREMGEHPCRSELPMGEDLRQAADRIEALSAENERLRGERAAIVAWLRTNPDAAYKPADAIEAGEHLK